MVTNMENYKKVEVLKNFEEPDNDVVKCSQHGKLHGYVHYAKKQLESRRCVTISGTVSWYNSIIP